MAEQVPKAVLQLMHDIELPTTLKEVNFPKADLDPFAEYIVKQRQFIYNLPKYQPEAAHRREHDELLHDMYRRGAGNLRASDL